MCDPVLLQRLLDLLEEEVPVQLEVIEASCGEWGVDAFDFLMGLKVDQLAHLGCASNQQLTTLVRQQFVAGDQLAG